MKLTKTNLGKVKNGTYKHSHCNEIQNIDESLNIKITEYNEITQRDINQLFSLASIMNCLYIEL